VFCEHHTFLSSGRNTPQECHSASLLGGGSTDGQLCTEQGTPERTKSFHKACASESLNFSATTFLLFGNEQYMIIVLCIPTLGSLLNNFKYRLLPFFHSNK
jgi:hypothetical protein